MANSNEHVEVLSSTPTTGWEPIVGPETADLLNYFKKEKHLDEEGCAILQGEARSILVK